MMYYLSIPGLAEQPDWVNRFPHSPGYYTGIGRVDKLNYPYKYKDIAREKALTQISREISIHIQSQSSLVQNQNKTGLHDDWSQEIQSSSSNNLWGYERVDSYETPLEFWVYYRLDRKKYQAYKKNKFQTQQKGLEQVLEKIKDNLNSKKLQHAISDFQVAHKIFKNLEQVEKQGVVLDKNVYFQYYFWRDTLSRIISRTELISEKNTLTYRTPIQKEQKSNQAIHFNLRDTRTGDHWLGPYTLLINQNDKYPDSGCEIRTDETGRIKLENFLAMCKPGDGPVKIYWQLPHSPWKKLISPFSHLSVYTSIDIKIVPVKINWKIQNLDSNMPENLKDRIIETLNFTGARPFPGFNQSGEDKTIRLILKEFHQDSLHGIHFTTFKGSLQTGSGFVNSQPVIIKCKGGHSQKTRSVELAINDFVNQVNQLIGYQSGYAGL